MSLKILSFNIHKGFNWRNSELTIFRIKENLQRVHPDIVFLQEVVGENKAHEKKIERWISNQFEFLAEDLWSEFAYSSHAVFDERHHGNVILSRFPIKRYEVIDISQNKYEQRAVLFCEIEMMEKTLHAYCVHLNLLHTDRVKQYEKINQIIHKRSDHVDHILLAGDFNDWNKQASKNLFQIPHFHDAHKNYHGDYGKTFPSVFPLLKLDRIYTKGFETTKAKVLSDRHWKFLSDHLPLYIEVEIL